MADPFTHIHPDLEGLSQAAARDAGEWLASRPLDRPLSIVLSGGSTPRRFHELLAEQPGIPWPDVHVFWGDERIVPHDDAQSNFRMARETLLDRVPLLETHVHPMPVTGTLEQAAAAYEAEIHRFFGGADPAFDLVLLGLGDDGHTASLFPGTEALSEDARWVVPGEAPPEAAVHQRLTLTYPILNHAHQVFFLVSGKSKRLPLANILFGPDELAARYPASRVRPAGDLHWYLDAAAYPAMV